MNREHYHHGDLRASLIATALKQLEAGAELLSLRAVAREAGVSPNAPYRHFADKSALLAALAATGFTQFADAMVEASAGEPVAALRAQGDAYLRFANARPALYRLMFSPLGYSLHSETCKRESARAFGSIIETTGRAQAAGWKPRLPHVDAVLGYWAALHGWAGLIADRLIPPEVPTPPTERWLDTWF